MLVTTRKWYCDACGKEMKEYSSSREIIEVDEDGYAHSVGYDFCLECLLVLMTGSNPERGLRHDL